MLGILKNLLRESTREVDRKAMMERLRQQAEKTDESSAEQNYKDELELLNHKHRAVLLSQDLGTARDHWPKLREKQAGNNGNRSDGFWNRAVGSQSEAAKSRDQILGSIQARY